MKKIKFLILSCATMFFFSSCATIFLFSSCGNKIKLNGPIAELSKTLTYYDEIVVEDAILVVVEHGDPGEITIETYESVFEYIETYIEDDVLYVGLNGNVYFDRDPRIKVTVPAKEISSVNISGASSIEVFGMDNVFTTGTLSVSLSGASTFNGAVNVERMDVESSGASNVYIKGGNVEDIELKLSGASTFNGEDFTTMRLTANLSGATKAYINITGEIVEANLSGASLLRCKGDYTLRREPNISGASEYERVDEF